jgi:hypothetical protein
VRAHMLDPKIGKKIHSCEFETNELANDLNKFFIKRIIEVLRIMLGYKQNIDTLISEEALLFEARALDKFQKPDL